MATRSPLRDAEALQHVGEALHLVEQLGVGDRAGVAGLALPVERDLVAVAGRRRGGRGSCTTTLSCAADEPLGERQLPLEDGVPVGRPVEQLGGLAGPEPLVVGRRVVVQRRVDDERVLLERLRRREGALLPGSASIVSFVSSAMFGPRCRR